MVKRHWLLLNGGTGYPLSRWSVEKQQWWHDPMERVGIGWRSQGWNQFSWAHRSRRTSQKRENYSSRWTIPLARVELQSEESSFPIIEHRDRERRWIFLSVRIVPHLMICWWPLERISKRKNGYFSQYFQHRFLASITKERQSKFSVRYDSILTVEDSTNGIDITKKSLGNGHIETLNAFGHEQCIVKIWSALKMSRHWCKYVNISTTDEQNRLSFEVCCN